MNGRGLYENAPFGVGIWLGVIMLLAAGFSMSVWATEGGVALVAVGAGVPGTGARSGQVEIGALDKGESVQGAMDNFDFQDIQDFINQQKRKTGWNLSLQEMMKDLMVGHLVQMFEKFLGVIKNTPLVEAHNGGALMRQTIILGIFRAVFTNFSSVFNGSRTPETGLFVTYLLLFTFLTTSFFQSITIASDMVGKVLDSMKVLMPTFFMAVAFTGGSVSSVAMYEFTLWIITAAQWLIGSGLIPLVRAYMILVLASHILREETTSNLTELLEQTVGRGLKTLTGVVLGFHVIQGLVLPYVDPAKNSAVQKLIGLIPGIGQGASAVAQMILGSGVLIENTMGMAAVVILLVITAAPMMKLAVLMVLYRCVAMVLEPVCDKRLISCVSAAAKGHKLLLNMVMAVALLLTITVAVICAGTNVSYYAQRLLQYRRGGAMSTPYSWVGNIVFYLIFTTVVVNLLPNKKYEKYLKLFSGMVFILLVLKPLTGDLRLKDKIAYYFEIISLQDESGDLRRELTGMEQQRLSQMTTQYERAIASDVEAMAVDMECYSVYTDVTIDRIQDSLSFDSVTHIRMAVTREPPGEVDSGRMGGSGAGSEPGTATPREPVRPVEQVKLVEIGEKTETAAEVPVPDETLNRLRRKVEGYYGLQTMDVEIQLEER